MDHELSRHNISTNTSMMPPADAPSSDTPCNDMQEEETNVEEMAKEFGTEFTLRQARLNEELRYLFIYSLFIYSLCPGVANFLLASVLSCTSVHE